MKKLFMVCFILLLSSNFIFAQDTYKVIVNKSNSVNSMSKKDVAKLFLKKTQKWEDGTKVMPVDLKEDNSVRAEFSKKVVGKSVAATKAYWQQQLFSGAATPPDQKETDAKVIKYVKENKGAVGYVSNKAEVNGVKVLTINK